MIYESRERAEAILILSCKELLPSVRPETIWSKAGLKSGASMSILAGETHFRTIEESRKFVEQSRSQEKQRGESQ